MKDWCDVRRGCISSWEYVAVFVVTILFLYFAYTTPFTLFQFLFGLIYIIFLIANFPRQLGMRPMENILYAGQWIILVYIGKMWLVDKVALDVFWKILLLVTVVVLYAYGKDKLGSR